jgi:DNA primase
MSGERARLVLAHERAISIYRRALYCPAGLPARRMLRERGLDALLAKGAVFSLGYAPGGWTHLADHLTRQDFTPDELVAAGLAVRAGGSGHLVDRFRDRLVFAVRDPGGEPIGFVGRALDPGPDTPKYLNSPETEIYHKGSVLVGLAEQRERLTPDSVAIVSEGPTDAAATALAYHRPDRILVGLTTCGTALTEQHLAVLDEVPGRLVLAFDGDRAGAGGMERAYALVRERGPDARVVLGAGLEPGQDPASLYRRDGAAGLCWALVERALPLGHLVAAHRIAEHLCLHGDLIEHRINAARTVAELLAEQPDVDAAIAFAADRLQLPLAAVADYVAETRPASAPGAAQRAS